MTSLLAAIDSDVFISYASISNCSTAVVCGRRHFNPILNFSTTQELHLSSPNKFVYHCNKKAYIMISPNTHLKPLAYKLCTME